LLFVPAEAGISQVLRHGSDIGSVVLMAGEGPQLIT
jgi:hypothetical protein